MIRSTVVEDHSPVVQYAHIPAQRSGTDPVTVEPGAGEPPAGRRRSWKPIALAAVAVLALVAGAGAVVFWPERAEPAAEAAPATKPTRAATPFEQTLEVLKTQATALEKGDETGWLAPVDAKQPKLVAAYRTIFRNLHSLQVGHVEYHARPAGKATKTKAIVEASLGYCFKGATCPSWPSMSHTGPPTLDQTMTLTLRGDDYVITGMKTDTTGKALSVPPWAGKPLSFATGKRVIVAGPANQKKHLKRILKLAEKSAAVTDRYAKLVDNQIGSRYRIYLADDRSWRSWYGGERPKWVIGYVFPLNTTGADIVLRTRAVLQQTDIAVVIQHELAHVVTLAGRSSRQSRDDQWLAEGVAEYIGAYPKKPQNTYSRFVLAESFRRRGAPKSIAVEPLGVNPDSLTVSTFYAMGHYASACLATKYGEAKLMRFTDLVLRQGQKPAEASPEAFGKSFKTVDKACLSWIRSRV